MKKHHQYNTPLRIQNFTPVCNFTQVKLHRE